MGDAMHLVERRAKFDGRIVADPRFECRENFRALLALDRQDERKAETLHIAAVEFLKAGKFSG